MDVSIIIVNYNTRDLTVNCINSIIENTKNIAFEIILVDNASSDGSPKEIKDLFTDIVLIESDKNVGFGRANNLAAAIAKGEFVFFLNSDTILIENSVKKLYDFFIANESRLNIGVLGSVLVDAHLNTNGYGAHFPNAKEERLKNLSRIPFFKFFLKLPKKQVYPLQENYFEIDYVIGADMFMKASLFKRLDGFAPDFFMYYEESDLQKRISNLGLKQYIITDTKIIHLEDGSGKIIRKYSNRKRIIVHQSRIIYLKRNEPREFRKFVMVDFLFTGLGLFNFKYSFKENLTYLRNVIKTY
ncbi:glycosyltransferase family 2 protein [Flavobacterium qiangtangense]|uniref:Glycosyltransferase family 2 protein n=1 Tax=Flavobacterium qiangtangense TaxID=1442595 RepID=A0ABW1PSY9_9FLAO